MVPAWGFNEQSKKYGPWLAQTSSFKHDNISTCDQEQRQSTSDL